MNFQTVTVVLELIANILHFAELQTALASHLAVDITRLGKGVKNQYRRILQCEYHSWFLTHFPKQST